MRPIALFLLALPLGAQLRIDHATIAGRSLKQIVDGLRAAGIATVYGGAHTNGVTEMALASFPDGSYLEAIALQPGAGPQAVDRHEWAVFLKTAGMPCAWAVQASGLAAETERLRTAGVEVSPPVRSGRARPDGVRLEWETVDLGNGVRGGFFPFLIHDLTPRPQRAFPSGAPTSRDFAGVARVVIAVGSLNAAIAKYHRAFGLSATAVQKDAEFGAEVAALGDTPVVLAQPLAAHSWLAERLERFGEGPCAFLLAGGRGAGATRWFGREIHWLQSGENGRIGTIQVP
jgi:hypothetical protein